LSAAQIQSPERFYLGDGMTSVGDKWMHRQLPPSLVFALYWPTLQLLLWCVIDRVYDSVFPVVPSLYHQLYLLYSSYMLLTYFQGSLLWRVMTSDLYQLNSAAELVRRKSRNSSLTVIRLQRLRYTTRHVWRQGADLILRKR